MLEIKIFNRIITIDKRNGVFVVNGDFKESEHPRDEDGKFTSGSGAEKKPEKLNIAEIKKRLTKEVSAEALKKRLSSLGSSGRGSGYLESGEESVNANIARSQGLATGKEIMKELKKSGYNIKEADMQDIIEPTEWHHTGRGMKKEYFYDLEDIDEEALDRISDRNDKQDDFESLKNKKWEKYKKLSDDELNKRYEQAGGDLVVNKMMRKPDRKKYFINTILLDDFKKETEPVVKKMTDGELQEAVGINAEYFNRLNREEKEKQLYDYAFYYEPELYKSLLEKAKG